MDVTVTNYRQQLLRLLPEGPAWPQDEGDLAVRVLNALAQTYLVVHQSAEQLHGEADPRSTAALLDDWERNYGLPDECMEPEVPAADRRARLTQKVGWSGGQSRQFFIEFLAALGYPGCTITEYRPFRANSKCNASLNQGGWRYAWRVNVPTTVDVRTMKVTGRCSEPLASWGDPGLQCILAKHKPAQTALYISYGAS
ncbi:YmfQ family protein [Cupriavidus taiwanensis]|uniref:YmfQ family protein n=1 Tax=Cupriavidus taiwanensis TaxID=164546 RepID=UPI0039C418D7